MKSTLCTMDANLGDSLLLLFRYSGHGLRQRNFNGDGVDEYDEVVCPLDLETQGVIVDDEVNATIVRPLPHRVLLSWVILFNSKGKSNSEKLPNYRKTADAVMCGLFPKSPTVTSSRTDSGLIWIMEWNALHPIVFRKELMLEQAEELFESLRSAGHNLDRSSYRLMMKVYRISGNHSKVEKLIDTMKELGVEPSDATMHLLLTSYATSGHPMEVEKIGEGLEPDHRYGLALSVLLAYANT